MDVELTKSFAFSASYQSGGRSLGRNYTLSVTVAALNEAAEREMEDAVRREVLDKIHTRDLSEGVDFLKGIALDDAALLKALWAKLSGPLAPYRPKRLDLRRDTRTVTTLYP